jgi:hypothetical protein
MADMLPASGITSARRQQGLPMVITRRHFAAEKIAYPQVYVIQGALFHSCLAAIARILPQNVLTYTAVLTKNVDKIFCNGADIILDW